MDVVLRRPERVASAVFVDSTLRGFPWSDDFLAQTEEARRTFREQGRAAALEAWFQTEVFRWVRERRPEVMERLRELYSGWSGAEWADQAEYPEQDVPDIELLHEVSVPVFVISGQEDAHDLVEIANMLAWWIPGAKQKSLLAVGHFPMLENPGECNLYLRAFLRAVSG
jgi:pimeloyl-ACP methyl ester carboxylesterase